MIAESGEYFVTLRDVGPEGVKLTGVNGFVFPEADVTLKILNQNLPGQVSWVDGDVIGVRLAAPMSKKMTANIARGISSARQPATARW